MRIKKLVGTDKFQFIVNRRMNMHKIFDIKEDVIYHVVKYIV